MSASSRHGSLALFMRLLGQAHAYRLHLLGILLFSFVASFLALLTPLPIRIAVDSVIGSRPVPAFLQPILPEAVTASKMGLLTFAAVLVVAIGLLVYLEGLVSWVLQTYTGEKLVLAFRGELFRHVQRLSLSYHDMKGTTDSTYRIQYDAPSIQWILVAGITPLVTAGATLGGMIYVTARIDWQLALVALAVSPVLFFFAWTSAKRLRSEWYEVKELHSSAMSVVQEVLAAVRVVKAFGQEEREHERFVRHARQGVWGQVRVAVLEGSFDLLVGLTIAIGTATALVIGVQHVRSDELSLGELLVVMAYLAQIYVPLRTMTKKIADLQGSLASADRAFSLLDEVPDVAERPGARPLVRAAGAVTFRDLSFAFAAEHPILRDISFSLGAGSHVGIMGATGAGKTTLVSLLMRFYDPTAGQILLDGVDLREYRLADVRQQFAIVLQDPVLFSSSIAENIAYARPGATRREIEAAAEQANAHEFIASLPEGYDTQVGERGMRLSGGERQRISLARAFLKNAPILILDEPTSAVDRRTESGILDAMAKLMNGRTVFMIAHHLSTLEHCDVLLRIEDGRLSRLNRKEKETSLKF
jgi:ATP-binding cassette, subfamily B, bacterial